MYRVRGIETQGKAGISGVAVMKERWMGIEHVDSNRILQLLP